MILPAVPAVNFHEFTGCGEQDELRLVSLGCYCGPKLTFRKLNRDAETLPFDWIRTRIDGVLDFLLHDFDKFFHYDTKELQSKSNPDRWLYRSYYHSFWHDNLSDPVDVEKYRRRIARFKAIDAHSKPVLFVRAVANDAEIQHLGTLCEVLSAQFGRSAKLLAIVDFQSVDEPLLVQSCENLLVYKLNQCVHSGENGDSPYVKPIIEGITWAKTGRADGARVIQNLSTENFNPNRMAWIAPSIWEPFEKVPMGSMKPFAPAGISLTDASQANLSGCLSSNAVSSGYTAPTHLPGQSTVPVPTMLPVSGAHSILGYTPSSPAPGDFRGPAFMPGQSMAPVPSMVPHARSPTIIENPTSSPASSDFQRAFRELQGMAPVPSMRPVAGSISNAANPSTSAAPGDYKVPYAGSISNIGNPASNAALHDYKTPTFMPSQSRAPVPAMVASLGSISASLGDSRAPISVSGQSAVGLSMLEYAGSISNVANPISSAGQSTAPASSTIALGGSIRATLGDNKVPTSVAEQSAAPVLSMAALGGSISSIGNPKSRAAHGNYKVPSVVPVAGSMAKSENKTSSPASGDYKALAFTSGQSTAPVPCVIPYASAIPSIGIPTSSEALCNFKAPTIMRGQPMAPTLSIPYASPISNPGNAPSSAVSRDYKAPTLISGQSTVPGPSMIPYAGSIGSSISMAAPDDQAAPTFISGQPMAPVVSSVRFAASLSICENSTSSTIPGDFKAPTGYSAVPLPCMAPFTAPNMKGSPSAFAASAYTVPQNMGASSRFGNNLALASAGYSSSIALQASSKSPPFANVASPCRQGVSTQGPPRFIASSCRPP